jgi:hypothetical protein
MLVQSSTEITTDSTDFSEVVVANSTVNSKFFLQDAHTERYFQGIERWTGNSDRALVFYDVHEALYICRWLGLSGVRIVSDFEINNGESLRAVA